MAKTIETYLRLSDPRGLMGDQVFFVGDESNRTVDSLFIPSQSFGQIEDTQEALRPILGETADQVFAVKQSRDFKVDDLEDLEVVLASGICPLPMDYNLALAPCDGAGSSSWYEARTGQRIDLPPDFADALDIVLENSPAISSANLMKAGCLGLAPTILIEEVSFYANWMLEKLKANSSMPPSEDQENRALQLLAEYIRRQFTRNVRCFEVMRRLVQKTVEIGALIRVEDTNQEYRDEIDEQIKHWLRDIPGGEALNVAGLQAAAYYSSALPRAYRNIQALGPNATLVIAEGAANVIVPDDGTAFNGARRRAFLEQNKDKAAPALLTYPSPALTPSLRKQRLEAEPITASPSTLQKDIQYFYKYPKRDNSLTSQPEIQWSQAMLGTPALRELQLAMIRGDVSATDKMTWEMNNNLTEIFKKAD